MNETKQSFEPYTPYEVGQDKPQAHEMMFLNGDIAAPALAGIRQSEIADKLELFQRHYADEQRLFPAVGRVRLFIANIFGFGHWNNALAISRLELKELALAHATALNNANAQKIQADFAEQHRILAGDLSEFRRFLLDNFPNELARGVELKRSLFDVAKEILLEKKK